MPDKNIVIGVGNLLFCDDGIGIIAVEYLKKNYEFTPKLELLDGGTLGFNLHQYFIEYDNVFIIDTISTDAKTGDIFKIPSDELLGSGSYKNTAHEVEVVHMLEICELYEKKAEVTIFGIVPQDIVTAKIGLSEVLESRFESLIELVIKELESLDIITIKKSSISLQDIQKELIR
ncbi:MAG: HyaD/HybD family hydrogenase maturation endopeptidase [Campylobacterota bacterium]|nr:HyaD/HybD family hydrogenase maturation endopeptidase [Campylobacterota bacterium]